MDPVADQPLSRVIVLNALLPRVKPTQRVEGRLITMAANFAAGAHVHNGPVVGNIVSGSVVYQIDGEAERILRAGDVFYEPEGARIMRFDALDEGAQFFGWFLLEEGDEAELTFIES